MNNKHLNKKQFSKIIDDEFYTQYSDIEKELMYYDFTNKIIYCPCDDWDKSNFCKYFYNNFHKLNLKKLYCSCLDGKFVAYNGKELKQYKLASGDFRSKECKTIFEQSDIVVTNPPFSILKDFMDIYSTKDFIIVIPILALKNSYISPRIFNWHIGKEIGNFIRPDGTKTHQACLFISTLNTNRDRKAVVVNKPISEYSFVTYKGKDYLWTKKINNIPDNYYEPMIIPIRFIMIRDNRFKVLATRIDPYNKEKKMFSQCLIQRIKE